MSEWVQRYLDAHNSHDPDRVAALYADDVVYEVVGSGSDWVVKGIDGIKAMVTVTHHFSSDAEITLTSEMRSGDSFALEIVETATNIGAVAPGVPATNKRYTVREVTVGRLDANERITEERVYVDRLDIYTQLGVIAAPGT